MTNTDSLMFDVITGDITIMSHTIFTCDTHESVNCVDKYADIGYRDCTNVKEYKRREPLLAIGQIMIVGSDSSGNAEYFPSGIRPHKWSFTYERFLTIEEAVEFSKELVEK